MSLLATFNKNYYFYFMTYEFSDGYKIRNQQATHFLTFTIEGWIDIFSRKDYRNIVLESFKFCQENKQLKIHAYVIMTNHIHVIWTAQNGNISDIIRDFKSHTSRMFLQTINTIPESRKDWLLYMFEFFGNKTNRNKTYKIWTSNNHPEEIESEDFFFQKLNYLHQNPVRANIVLNQEDYIFSSASNYAKKKKCF
jgi:REP element-mobilizing transposase RayT